MMCLIDLKSFSKDFIISICYENDLFLPLIKILINRDSEPDYLSCFNLFFRKFKEANQKYNYCLANKSLSSISKNENKNQNDIEKDYENSSEDLKEDVDGKEEYLVLLKEKKELWNLLLGIIYQSISPEIYSDFSHLMPEEIKNLKKESFSQLFAWIFEQKIFESLLLENPEVISF